jgi:hypothetical protein
MLAISLKHQISAQLVNLASMVPVLLVLAPGRRALHLAHADQVERVCVLLLLRARGIALMEVQRAIAFLLVIQALIVQVARFVPLGPVVGSMSVWVQLFVEVAMERT